MKDIDLAESITRMLQACTKIMIDYAEGPTVEHKLLALGIFQGVSRHILKVAREELDPQCIEWVENIADRTQDTIANSIHYARAFVVPAVKE